MDHESHVLATKEDAIHHDLHHKMHSRNTSTIVKNAIETTLHAFLLEIKTYDELRKKIERRATMHNKGNHNVEKEQYIHTILFILD